MSSSSRDSPSNSRPSHKRHSSSSSSRTTLKHIRNFDLQQSLEEAKCEMPTSSSSTSTSGGPRINKTSWIMSSVRKSLNVSYPTAPKRQPQINIDRRGMYSTPEERDVQLASRFRRNDPSSSPPTVEQIAMGLHISRTPHLRPPFPQRAPGTAAPHHRSTPPLPPPPTRSSLKKPPASLSNPGLLTPSASSTTVTSSNTSSNFYSNHSFASLKMRMSRFLPGSLSSSAPSSILSSPISSPRQSTSDFVSPPSPKKAVRFSAPDLEPEE